VIRLRAMAKDGTLKYPIIAVNDAQTKHFFDNRYGHRTVNLGRRDSRDESFAGWTESCGCRVRLVRPRNRHARQRSRRGRNHYRNRSHQGIEAVMDGFRVMADGRRGEGRRRFYYRHGKQERDSLRTFEVMKTGAVVCNSGHFNVEIDIPCAGEIVERQKRSAAAGR